MLPLNNFVNSGKLFFKASAITCCTVTVSLSTDLGWVTVLLSLVGKVGSSAAFATIFLYSAEFFPTVIRNSALGVANFCARIGGMIAPYVVDLVLFFQFVAYKLHWSFLLCIFDTIYHVYIQYIQTSLKHMTLISKKHYLTGCRCAKKEVLRKKASVWLKKLNKSDLFLFQPTKQSLRKVWTDKVSLKQIFCGGWRHKNQQL